MRSISIKHLVEEHKLTAPARNDTGYMELTKRISDAGSALYTTSDGLPAGYNYNITIYMQSFDELLNAEAQGLAVKFSHTFGAL